MEFGAKMAKIEVNDHIDVDTRSESVLMSVLSLLYSVVEVF